MQKHLDSYLAYSKFWKKTFLIAEKQREIVRNPVSNQHIPKWSYVKAGKPWNNPNLWSIETNVKSSPDNGNASNREKGNSEWRFSITFWELQEIFNSSPNECLISFPKPPEEYTNAY